MSRKSSKLLRDKEDMIKSTLLQEKTAKILCKKVEKKTKVPFLSEQDGLVKWDQLDVLETFFGVGIHVWCKIGDEQGQEKVELVRKTCKAKLDRPHGICNLLMTSDGKHVTLVKDLSALVKCYSCSKCNHITLLQVVWVKDLSALVKCYSCSKCNHITLLQVV